MTVCWGDGTPAQTLTAVDQVRDLFSGCHTYSQGGLYSVTVRVTDDDGGSVTATTSAYVSGVSVVNGVLYVIGTSGTDYVDVNLMHNHGNSGPAVLRVMTQFNVCATCNGWASPSVYSFDPSAVHQIVVLGGGGQDHIVIHDDVTVPVAILEAATALKRG